MSIQTLEAAWQSGTATRADLHALAALYAAQAESMEESARYADGQAYHADIAQAAAYRARASAALRATGPSDMPVTPDPRLPSIRDAPGAAAAGRPIADWGQAQPSAHARLKALYARRARILEEQGPWADDLLIIHNQIRLDETSLACAEPSTAIGFRRLLSIPRDWDVPETYAEGAGRPRVAYAPGGQVKMIAKRVFSRHVARVYRFGGSGWGQVRDTMPPDAAIALVISMQEETA